MIINVIEQEYRTRPEGSEGNEGYRKSHVDVNHGKIAENSASNAISQGNQTGRIGEKELNQEEARHSIEPSEGSDPSGQVIEDSSAIEQQKVPDSIYRIGHSDLFGCIYCKIKGDKPFMMKHPQYCKAGVAAGRSKQNSNGGDKKVN